MPEMQGSAKVQPVVQPVRMPEMQGSAKVQPVVQPVRMPEMQGSAKVQPMMQPAHSGSEMVEHGTAITINAPITINAAPGMDERAVAREVSRALEERERQAQARRRGRLYD
jgi:hypothetical protein